MSAFTVRKARMEDVPAMHGLLLASARQGLLLVRACLEEGPTLGITRVFALTYQEAFFARLGFAVVDKSVLPQKIWADCVHCAKYPDCDETAVFLNLTAPVAGVQGGNHV